MEATSKVSKKHQEQPDIKKFAPSLEIRPSLPKLKLINSMSEKCYASIEKPSSQLSDFRLKKAYSTLDKLGGKLMILKNQIDEKPILKLDKSLTFLNHKLDTSNSSISNTTKTNMNTIGELNISKQSLLRSFTTLKAKSTNLKSIDTSLTTGSDRSLRQLDDDLKNQLSMIQKNSSVYFKNARYELIETLNQNGTFSQETKVVMSQNSGKTFVFKKLLIFVGNKKETVTKIYENFNQIEEFHLNLNLNRLVDTYLSNDVKYFCIIQDYCATSLKVQLKLCEDQNLRVGFEQMLNWFRQAMSAIRFLHETCQIVHGNIKPTNILLNADLTQLKLADFGYMNIYNKFKYIVKIINDPVNKLYLPLETFKAFKYTYKSEIYSLGSVFYEIIYLENAPLLKPNRITMSCQGRTVTILEHNENFSFLLESMLHCVETNRPNSIEIAKFMLWQKSIEYVASLKTSFGFNTQILTHLIAWKQTKDKFERNEKTSSRHFVLKQINLNPIRFQAVCDILPSLLRTKLENEKLLCLNNYLIINNRLLTITDHLSSEHDYLNLEQKLTRVCEKNNFLSDQFVSDVLIGKWLFQIVDALEYLHSNSLIHGNLKLENIFINSNNFLKLVDFGFYHLLAESDTENETTVLDQQSRIPASINENESKFLLKTPRELTKNSYYPVSYKLDIFQLGIVLFKCLTFNNSNAGQNNFQGANGNNQINPRLNGNRVINLRKLIVNMVSVEPFDRPELKTILSTLNSKIENKFHNNLLSGSNSDNVAKINGRILNFFSREKDFIIIRTFRKRTYRTFIDWQCLKIAKQDEPNQSEVRMQQFSFFDTMLLVKKHSPSINSSQCSCSSLITKLNDNSEAGTSFGNNLLFPKCFCQITNNYLIGANSELIYLIDENLKYVKSACLIETLEMKRETEQQQNSSYNQQQKKHTTLINKFDLRLDTVSVCYDHFDVETRKIYLLTSVHDQYFFINVFELDFNLKYKISIKNMEQPQLSQARESNELLKQAEFNLYLRSKYFIQKLSTEFLSKKILCNQNYLFICERNLTVRVFGKQNGKYLFSIKNNPQGNSKSNDNAKNSVNELIKSNFDDLSLKNGKVKDISVDTNGNLYVAYHFSINVFNEYCEFLWRYDFQNELNNLRIVQISTLKTNSIGLLVEDEKNNFSNKLFIYD